MLTMVKVREAWHQMARTILGLNENAFPFFAGKEM